jgi:hypothetical protein
MGCFFISMLGFDSIAAPPVEEGVIGNLDQTKKIFSDDIFLGGSFLCDIKGNKVSQNYRSCSEYKELKKKGCYGCTNIEMKRELNYQELCSIIGILERGLDAGQSYFDLANKNWWRELPLALFPLPDGVYSDESLDEEKSKLKAMLKGKVKFGDLLFKSIKRAAKVITLKLIARKDSCGLVKDTIELKPLTLIDINNDKNNELMISIRRTRDANECGMGLQLGGQNYYFL